MAKKTNKFSELLDSRGTKKTMIWKGTVQERGIWEDGKQSVKTTASKSHREEVDSMQQKSNMVWDEEAKEAIAVV